VDPNPDPLLLRRSGSAGNRTQGLWICSQELCPLDHRGGHWIGLYGKNNILQKTMNTENLVSIHLPVQYRIILYGRNNVSYRNMMVIENLIFIFTSSVLNRVRWIK
jgi:hypothetical protein